VVDSTLASQTLDFCYELTVATANVPQATTGSRLRDLRRLCHHRYSPHPPARPSVTPVQPPLVAPGVERRYRRVVIHTPVRWENWQDFYNKVIDPLIREGADLSIRIEVTAQSDTGIRENTVELGIKESLLQRGVAPEIEAE